MIHKRRVETFYDAFGIEKYQHNLNKVDQLKINGVKYNDTTYGNMHTIRNTIKKVEYDIERYVPSHIMKINDIDIP